MPKYSVFIPFHNEVNILESHVLRVYNHLKKRGNFELQLIDDGSTDSSLSIARELSRKKKYIKVISCKGPSRRENLFERFRESKSEIIAFTDIDLAVHESYFDDLFDAIEQGSDICIASRYEKESKVTREWWRRSISLAYTHLLRALFSCKLNDFQCGFKAFKRESMEKVLEQVGYDHSFKRGWFLDAEFLIRANRAGKKIKAIPVEWNCGRKSTFKIPREMRMIPYVLRLWWRI
jgi:glycosyltransferase involved in cell wall biosynthesis